LFAVASLKMIIPYVAFDPFSWLARTFGFFKDRLKRIRWQQAISLAGGTVAVYLIYSWFTSGKKEGDPPGGHRLKHRRTYSSPKSSGSYVKDPIYESSSEEGYNADPNYTTSVIYKEQQKAQRNNMTSDIDKKQADYEANKSLATLKENYEKGLLPLIFAKSRISISSSLQAIFRTNGDPSHTMEKSNKSST